VPAPKGPGVDQSIVERVKALRAMGTSQATIAKQLDIHISTVRRYERRIDDTPELQEARVRELERCVGEGYEIIHLAMALVHDALQKKEIKGKDAAVITGIMADKTEMWVGRLAPQAKDTETITFKFVSDGTDNKPLPDTGEVPHLPGEVQGGDSGDRVREDLLRLPGGSQDGSGIS